MGRISALTEVTELASNDYFIVLDSSANIAKKVSVQNALGIPDFGWTAAGETWTFSSFNSTLRTGVITVPSDATTKYTLGAKIKLTQTTGGTKFAKIVGVTSTTLTLQFASGITLNNEAITLPFYSFAENPIGFPADNSFIITYTQSGSGGGTGYFTNDNGIKKCWGATGLFTGGSGGAVSLSFPTGFFTTVQSAQLSSYQAANTSIHGALAYNSMGTTGMGAFAGGSPSGNQAMQWLATGV